MRHDLIALRRSLLTMMGLAVVGQGCVVNATLLHDTDDDTDPVVRTCEEAPELTADDINQVTWEPSRVMVCSDNTVDCPTLDTWEASQFVAEQLGVQDPEYCWWQADSVCGPETAEPDRCCYVMDLSVLCEGRPLRVKGVALTAPSIERADWCDVDIVLDEGIEHSEALGQRWLRSAAFEHASVASFARAALELMQLGAPPHLLDAVTTAMADEVRHARHAYAIASALLKCPVGPGPLILPSLQTRSAEQVLVDTIHEGCIGETLAAAVARAGAEHAEEAIRSALLRVADDETRHAGLAWRTVAWLLQTHPELTTAAKRAFSQQDGDPSSSEPQLPDAALHRVGLLTDHERSQLVASARRQVIAPLAAALFAEPTPSVALHA